MKHQMKMGHCEGKGKGKVSLVPSHEGSEEE